MDCLVHGVAKIHTRLMTFTLTDRVTGVLAKGCVV